MGMIMPVTHLFEPCGTKEKTSEYKVEEMGGNPGFENILSQFPQPLKTVE